MDQVADIHGATGAEEMIEDVLADLSSFTISDTDASGQTEETRAGCFGCFICFICFACFGCGSCTW